MATAWAARHGLTSDQYQVEFDKLVGQGFRLVHVNGYTVNGTDRYAAIWDKSPSPGWVARHGMTAAQYQTEFDKFVGQGFRLVEVSGYTRDGQDRYAAIWDKSPSPGWVARHGMSSAQYQAEFDKFVGQGFRLVLVSGYEVGGQARYAAIWSKASGPAWAARHGMTSAQYQAEFNSLIGQGFRLIQVSGYSVGGQDRYAAIWDKSSGPAWLARHGMSSAQYQGEFDNAYYQGYRLAWVSGYGITAGARYAAIWKAEGIAGSDLGSIDTKVKAYMTKHSIPGLSVAITKDERLVFAKGYGEADPSAGEKVNPKHRFRVASVSKPITAVDVMDLIEAGKLQLDGKVFGTGAILGTTYGTKAYSDEVKKITVRHLLQHTSGFTNDGGDPMFAGHATHKAVIDWMLDNRPLKTTPGMANEYSNFGYCVLGRVIEKVTGQTYENHVKLMLGGCGISRMEIGGDTLADRKPAEVVYQGSGAYNLRPRHMDAHGGWIATPIDLLRLMVRTDGFAAKTDILFANTETTMFSGAPANPGYGLGWIVDTNYRGHNGAMRGTIGFLVRRNDGFSFAVLCNTRPANDGFCFELKGVIDAVVSSSVSWPAYDLF